MPVIDKAVLLAEIDAAIPLVAGWEESPELADKGARVWNGLGTEWVLLVVEYPGENTPGAPTTARFAGTARKGPHVVWLPPELAAKAADAAKERAR